MQPTTAGLIATNGVELWTESFGAPSAPTFVLISGADSPASRWDLGFVEQLVSAGYGVVRFDNRDCGLSTKFDSDDLYTLDDMARDVAGLMDALGVPRAHIVGRSMGGMIGQVMALDHQDLVESLGLLITSPGLGDDRLPGPHDDFVDKMAARLLAPPPVSREERIEYQVELFRMMAGTAVPIDDARLRESCAAEVDRMWYPESGHGFAAWNTASRIDRLRDIAVPCFIMHGTADPVTPVEHAYMMRDLIRVNEAWIVEGLGHETPPALSAPLATRLLTYLRQNR